MKKDIEWLKKEFDDLFNGKTILTVGRSVVDKILDQLDEPEVLSEEWIGKYAHNIEEYWEVADMMDKPQYAVSVENLNNLLVPKQDLPVIPKFVAEVLEKNKRDNFKLIDTYSILIERGFDMDRLVQDWLQEDWTREETFARAWLDGYTVEEEQRYIVKIPTNENNDIPYAIVADSGDIWIDALPSKYKLTEEEIRGLTKGDVLFEHFAVKVEELEE